MKKVIRLNESQLNRLINETVRRVLMENDNLYVVQETIGGWRQNPIFKGTYEECEQYCADYCTGGNYAIVPFDEYEVDYLNNDDDSMEQIYAERAKETYEKLPRRTSVRKKLN